MGVMKTPLTASLFLLMAMLAGPVRADVWPAGTPLEAPGPQGPLEGTLLQGTLPTVTSELAGSPNAPRPVATVLIIPGSGPTDRDGNNPLGVKGSIYRLLAQGLAAQGIATLRIDKRGMFASARSVADASAVTISDYVQDVGSWVAVLRKLTGAPCVWLLGHSEGGLVAMAAAASADAGKQPALQAGLCGLVLVSSPGRPLGEVLREQLKANPANGPLFPQALAAIDALEDGRRVDTQDMHPALMRIFKPANQAYLIDAFSYDPARLVKSLTKPVLIVQGQRDLQVSAEDARLIQKADAKAQLALLPDVNHVLKSVTSQNRQDNLATYGNPDLPLAPSIVSTIAEFLKAASIPSLAPSAPARADIEAKGRD